MPEDPTKLPSMQSPTQQPPVVATDPKVEQLQNSMQALASTKPTGVQLIRNPQYLMDNAEELARKAVAPIAHAFKTDVAPQFVGVGGQIADAVGSTIFPNDYMRERTPVGKPDPFAYRGAPIPTPPPAAPSPVAAAPAAAGPTKDNGFVVPETAAKAPTAGVQELIAHQNASRTPVSNPYEGSAAGMAPPGGGVHGSIGVEGFQKQLQNIRALNANDPAPLGPGILHSTLNDEIAAWNARMDVGSAQDALASRMRGAGSREERAAYGQMANTVLSGQNQMGVAGIQQSGANARQDSVNGVQSRGQDVQARGQDLTHGLGMLQVGAQTRGQDLTHAGRMLTNESDMARANLSANVQREGQQAIERTHAADRAARTTQVAGTNAAHLATTGMQVDAQRESAKDKVIVDGLGGMFQFGRNRVWQPAHIDKNTGKMIPAGMVPIAPEKAQKP